MKIFIVLSALVAVALARPGHLYGGAVVAPVTYTHLVPGAPIGPDGRVVDTPEVAVAKAEHAAAHVNEKITLAKEAVNSAGIVAYTAPAVVAKYAAAPAVVSAYSSPAVVSAYSAPAVVSAYRAAPFIAGAYPVPHGLTYSKLVY